MPTLSWPSKQPPLPVPASLEVDSLVYPQGRGYPQDSPLSHLVLGDNLAVMSALLPEYAGRVDLIYADPPFFTNRRYTARIGRGEDSRRPQEWQLAEGYPDSWHDVHAYLDMLYPRLVLMHRLLSPTGTLYLHLDWHANAYARLLLDEIFGPDRLLNEIIWIYHGPSPIRTAFNRKHDTILVYTKSPSYTFNVDAVRQPYDPSTVKTFAASTKAGFGKVPNLARGKVPEDWWYFPVVARLHNERTGYPTQKPEALLERIFLASSNPGDLVADFFCGSGTAPLVATRLGRRFLASDGAWRAIHTTRSRLVQLPGVPFSVQKVKTTNDRRQAMDERSYLTACGQSRELTASGQSPTEAENSGLSPSSFVYRHNNQTLILSPDLLQDLDYWEIDPAWDGIVFRSARQVARPRRKNQPVAGEIGLDGLPTAGPLCFRGVTIRGQVRQLVFEKKL